VGAGGQGSSVQGSLSSLVLPVTARLLTHTTSSAAPSHARRRPHQVRGAPRHSAPPCAGDGVPCRRQPARRDRAARGVPQKRQRAHQAGARHGTGGARETGWGCVAGQGGAGWGRVVGRGAAGQAGGLVVRGLEQGWCEGPPAGPGTEAWLLITLSPQGLEYLHNKNIVHFDLKSANLVGGRAQGVGPLHRLHRGMPLAPTLQMPAHGCLFNLALRPPLPPPHPRASSSASASARRAARSPTSGCPSRSRPPT
jgi:hypothetical protein